MTDLKLAAHWKARYDREYARRKSAEATLIGVRRTRDYYHRLVRGYELQLGIRVKDREAA